VWDGFVRLIDTGSIRPVVYREEYGGLEAVGRALEDVKAHKTWGRAVVRVCEHEDRARL
jgi:hypothetical protein